MARIKSKNTKPELLVRKLLFANGLRYRLHAKDLPGKPDIYIKKYKTVIDIRGCFWHAHDNCKLATKPKTNKGYWVTKLHNNKERDLVNQKLHEDLGFKVFIIWD
jgi:DNA mismatch endonuclease (patch repair protein)